MQIAITETYVVYPFFVEGEDGPAIEDFYSLGDCEREQMAFKALKTMKSEGSNQAKVGGVEFRRERRSIVYLHLLESIEDEEVDGPDDLFLQSLPANRF